MLTNTKVLALTFALIFVGTSCEDLLKVEPRNSVNAAGVLSTTDAIEAAINSVYARLRAQSNYGRDLLALSDALADVGFATNNSGRLINENRNIAYNHFTHWQNSYFAINEINITLKGVADLVVTPAPSQATIDRWIGSLKFLRALYYHDLARAYAYDPGANVAAQDRGGVPLLLEPIFTSGDAASATRPRASVSEVYAAIYADLNDAIAKLPTTGGPFFATKAAAQGLLSRVALYNKDYSTVVTAATDAFAAPNAILASGSAYVNGWRGTQNPESLFEVKFQDANESLGVNVSMQSSFTSALSLGALNGQGGWGDLAPHAAMRSLIGITGPVPGAATVGQVCTGTDVRTQLYAIGFGRGSGPKVECIKFISKNGIPYLDNVPVIRESEMILNRAEAYATPGSSAFNQTLALADLNTLRVARGLPTVSLTGTALFNEIINQRWIEFAFEGHRFFDLKRRGQNITKVGTFVGAADLPFTDFKLLANIPQREVDGNPNLQQNFGY